MKKIIVILIALLPINIFRIFLYRILLGYKISFYAKIGLFTIVNVDKCEIGRVAIGMFNYLEVGDLRLSDGVVIGHFNRFKWLSKLSIGELSTIRSNNVMFGTRLGVSPFKGKENFTIGKLCVITNRHSFDVSDEINIGDDVTIGGIGTQFWTHGFDLLHVKMQAGIEIGSHVYIGSRSLVLQGVSIMNEVVIGAGSTVSRSITESGVYVSSVLLRKGDVPLYADIESVIEHKGYRFTRRNVLDLHKRRFPDKSME